MFVTVYVVNGTVTDSQPPRLHIDNRSRTQQSGVDCRSGSEWLERRPGFEQIDNRTISCASSFECLAVIRVVARPICQCQHFATVCIENDDARGLRPVLEGGLLHFTISEVLHVTVD